MRLRIVQWHLIKSQNFQFYLNNFVWFQDKTVLLLNMTLPHRTLWHSVCCSVYTPYTPTNGVHGVPANKRPQVLTFMSQEYWAVLSVTSRFFLIWYSSNKSKATYLILHHLWSKSIPLTKNNFSSSQFTKLSYISRMSCFLT